MAWEDITDYSADELAAAKAEVEEVSALIEAKVAKIEPVFGCLTEEEGALLAIKKLVDARIEEMEGE